MGHTATAASYADYLQEAGLLRSPSRSGRSPLQRSSLVLAQPTPNPRILICVKGILETVLRHWAMGTNRFSPINLLDSRSRVAHREEKFWIYRQTRCPITPVHTKPPIADLPRLSKSARVLRKLHRSSYAIKAWLKTPG